MSVVWVGPPELKRLLTPIESCLPHPDNPRRGNLDVLAESLETFGQLRPILVQRSTGYIVAGNHTRRAAAERLGWNRIAQLRVDLDDQDARRYLLADNRTSDLASYDADVLIPTLRELMNVGKLVGTGYDADAVENLIAEHDRVAETARATFAGGYSESPEELEARSELRKGGRIMREVVLTYDPDRFEQFQNFVRMCKREWGLNGVMDTVFEMAKRSAESL